MANKNSNSTYDPSFIDKVDEFLDQCQDGTQEGSKKIKVNLPSIEKFSKFIGTTSKTIRVWEKENPDFKIATDKIHMEQKIRLIDGGLSNTYNPWIARLLLSANHGMVERSDVTSGEKPLPLFDYTKKKDSPKKSE